MKPQTIFVLQCYDHVKPQSRPLTWVCPNNYVMLLIISWKLHVIYIGPTLKLKRPVVMKKYAETIWSIIFRQLIIIHMDHTTPISISSVSEMKVVNNERWSVLLFLS